MTAARSTEPTFYIVDYKRLWVRSTPSTTGEKVGAISERAIVGVTREFTSADGLLWAELAPEERNFFVVCVKTGDSTGSPQSAFILIDGAPLGLPILLRRLPSSDEKRVPPLELVEICAPFEAQLHPRRCRPRT